MTSKKEEPQNFFIPEVRSIWSDPDFDQGAFNVPAVASFDPLAVLSGDPAVVTAVSSGPAPDKSAPAVESKEK